MSDTISQLFIAFVLALYMLLAVALIPWPFRLQPWTRMRSSLAIPAVRVLRAIRFAVRRLEKTAARLRATAREGFNRATSGRS